MSKLLLADCMILLEYPGVDWLRFARDYPLGRLVGLPEKWTRPHPKMASIVTTSHVIRLTVNF